jgi:hypothetical protein
MLGTTHAPAFRRAIGMSSRMGSMYKQALLNPEWTVSVMDCVSGASCTWQVCPKTLQF